MRKKHTYNRLLQYSNKECSIIYLYIEYIYIYLAIYTVKIMTWYNARSGASEIEFSFHILVPIIYLS